MGRPRVDDPRRPTTVGLSRAERRLFQEKAARTGMSQSGLLVWLLENAPLPPGPLPVSERPVLPLRRRPDGTQQEVVDPVECSHPADRVLVLEWGSVCRECGTRLV